MKVCWVKMPLIFIKSDFSLKIASIKFIKIRIIEKSPNTPNHVAIVLKDRLILLLCFFSVRDL